MMFDPGNPGAAGKPELRQVRVIKAPPQRVYEAWVRPELCRQWWSADVGMACGVCEIDARVGGKFRISMSAKGVEYISVGEYLEVQPPHKLVFTWSWEAPPGGAQNTVVTLEFKAVPEGTELTLTHRGFGSIKSRDNHQTGWANCLANLAAFCE
ncbi:MAG: SRPBCC domain-containing protein [Phycisphaerae bacterium]